MPLSEQIYTFGNFQLDAANRRLLHEGVPVSLPAKAFDLLLTLIKNRGRLVLKDELFSTVWQDQIVEESNLTVHISAIRKALGETKQNPHFITTVPGYGYRFDGKVLSADKEADLVIETQTISRTVIERVPDESVNGISLATTDLSPTSKPESSPIELGAISAAPLSAPPRSLSQRYRSVALLVGLVVFSVGVVGGAWIYQSRARNRQTAVAPTAPKLTMRRFTTAGGVPYRVAISPDGKSVVYVQRFKGKDSLWLGQIETNSSVLIYQEPDLLVVSPTFATDGNSIYFLVKGDKRPQSTLVRMSILGGAVTEVVRNVDSPVSFSPDGKQLAFLRNDGAGNQASIIIADTADGKNERAFITRKSPEKFSSVGVAWSPDGKTIAFGANKIDGRDEILTVSVAEGHVNRISGRDWGSVDNLVWLPDGNYLAVIAKENIGERLRQIWLVPYPDGQIRKISDDLNSFLHAEISVSATGKLAVSQGHYNAEIWIAPNGDAKEARRVLQGVAPRYEGIDGLAWTPNEHLLYSAYVGDSQVIWSINDDGSNPRQLTPGKANASDINVSVTADGQYVVFQSNRSGGIEIWRANIDGTDLRQLTNGGNNSLPSLSPDGRWVFYNSTVDGRATLWRISIDGGDALQLSEESAVQPEISPDGKYITYLSPTAGSGVRLLVIPFAGGEPVKSFPVPATMLRSRQVIRWTPDGQALIYKDDFQGLWRQALNEQKPQSVKGFEELPLRNLAWSLDGKSLAYTTGTISEEIILIENVK